MRLDDAQLCLLADALPSSEPETSELIASAAAGGVDIVIVPGPLLASGPGEALRDGCRAEELLLLAQATDAGGVFEDDGAYVPDATGPLGEVRAAIGVDRVLATRSVTPDEALLADEVGVDAVLYDTEADPLALARARGLVRVPFYAGPVREIAQANAWVSQGCVRLFFKLADIGNEPLQEFSAGLSRALGRTI